MVQVKYTYNITKKKHKCYTPFAFLLFAFFIATSQEKKLKTHDIQDSNSIKFIQIEKELSGQYVSSIIQGKDDFLWVGTQDGLYRFDGNNIKSYKYNPVKESLPGTWVRTISQDTEGVFWLGINGFGLVRFDSEKNKYKMLPSELGTLNETSGSIVLQTLCSKTGDIWIRTENGVFKKNKNDQNFTKITSTSATIIINETVNGKVLIAKDTTLFYSQDSTNKLIPELNNVAIEQIEPTIEDQIIYKSKGNLFEYDLETKNSKPINIPKKINIISNFQNNIIYFLSKNKLYKFNTETKKILALSLNNLSLKISDIKTLYIDSYSVLWVGSRKGLYKQNVIGDIFKETIPLHARGIIVDDTHVYIAGRTGFHKYNKENKTITPIIKDTYFLSVYKSSNGFWLGDIEGNVHFIDYKGSITIFDKIINKKNNPIRDIYGIAEDINGHIWIGSWVGLHLINNNGTFIKTFSLKAKNKNRGVNTVKLYIDKKGALWVNTVGNGVYKIPEISKISSGIKDFNYKQYLHKKGDTSTINSEVLYEIIEEENGKLWFGTNYGINQYFEETDTFKSLKKDNNLFDYNVMSLQIDKKNLLWISTIRNGLFIHDLKTNQYFNLNQKDGLVSNAYLFNSSASYNNKLYFGTEDNVQVINSENLIYPKIEKSPLITDLNIYGQDEVASSSTLNNKELTLKYNESNFTIRFQLLDFRFSDKVNYFYKIKEIQENWRKTKDNIANFTNLQPGKYHFLLKATYQSKLSNSSPEASMIIIITPPWYKTWWAYTLYSFALLSIIMLLYRFNLNRKIAVVEKQKTLELDGLKSKMYANISHEFRTPLTLINGLSKVLIEESKGNKSTEKLEGIHRSGNQLLKLVNQILGLVSFDAGKVKANYKNGDVIAFIKQCVSYYKFYSDSKQQQLTFSSKMEFLKMDFDDDKLQKIINNVLSNAIKFTPEKGIINVEIEKNNQNLILKISDSGKGIETKHLPHIFDRYYKILGSDFDIGNGIGMALTKEFVTLLKGTITVESEIKKGATFTIQLPIKNTLKTTSELVYQIPFVDNIPKTQNIETLIVNKKASHTLLLVEDNEEIRNYITLLLGKHYNIITAKNGVEGLKVAKTKNIDFIISDVMMPKMDGFEFCEHIKNDIKTSHIPFVIISAKTAKEDKLKGHELGIDAYLFKPFDKDELLIIIKNLLQKKQEQINYFSKLLQLKESPGNIITNQLDINLIRNLQEHVLDKNNKLSIDQLAKTLGTSRTQLHRKIKALTNMSVTNYINHIRIEKAKHLLLNTKLNSNEIAYEVGFESSTYFSRIFKKKLGIAPILYREKHA